MHYLATIYDGWDRHAMSFNTVNEAENWIDANNSNGLRSTIDIFDENWMKIESIEYTEETK